jgi:AbrB family looped-hinge helix DNA binding protein
MNKALYSLHVKSRVSSQGQVTIPAEIRDRLGLTPGTPVEFELVEGGALLRKGPGGTHPVDRVYGTLRLPQRVDALLDRMRGPRPRKR